jgi:Tfp pilus assembly protein PilV
MVSRGYALLEVLLGVLILSIVIPSIVPIMTQPLSLIFNAFQQQIKIQDHLFIDHLIRHDIDKTISYSWVNTGTRVSRLRLTRYDGINVDYYVHNNQLKRFRGRTKILTKQYSFSSFLYTTPPSMLIIQSDFLPIRIALPDVL